MKSHQSFAALVVKRISRMASNHEVGVQLPTRAQQTRKIPYHWDFSPSNSGVCFSFATANDSPRRELNEGWGREGQSAPPVSEGVGNRGFPKNFAAKFCSPPYEGTTRDTKRTQTVWQQFTSLHSLCPHQDSNLPTACLPAGRAGRPLTISLLSRANWEQKHNSLRA